MKFEFSAGGIVFKRGTTQKKNQARNNAEKIFVLVCQHSQHYGWVFPKGLIGDHVLGEKKSVSAKGFGETKEEAAVREVEEETGIKAKIIKALRPVTYWYVFEGVKIKKTVYYFLMEYLSGDITKHDVEMENVEWLDIDEVENRLTYKSDKQVWQETRELIESTSDGGRLK